MEPPRFTTEISRLRHAGWSCQWDASRADLPAAIYSRYPWLPEDYLDFITGLGEFVSADGTRRILVPADFGITAPETSAHDRCEKMSLDAARGDAARTEGVRGFWDGHLPVFMDTSRGVSFGAIRVGDRSGFVVHGRVPASENNEVVADGFTKFLGVLA